MITEIILYKEVFLYVKIDPHFWKENGTKLEK